MEFGKIDFEGLFNFLAAVTLVAILSTGTLAVMGLVYLFKHLSIGWH